MWLRGKLLVAPLPRKHAMCRVGQWLTCEKDFEGQKLVELLVNVSLSAVGVGRSPF